jgi:hypothetical protein
MTCFERVREEKCKVFQLSLEEGEESGQPCDGTAAPGQEMVQPAASSVWSSSALRRKALSMSRIESSVYSWEDGADASSQARCVRGCKTVSGHIHDLCFTFTDNGDPVLMLRPLGTLVTGSSPLAGALFAPGHSH